LVHLSVFVCMQIAALAVEGGTPAFPNGGEDFHVAAMPPPGWYGLLYSSRYRADFLANDSGDRAVAGFGLTVAAITPRLDWVKPASILGADRWGTLFIVPLLDIDLSVTPAPGVSIQGRRRAFGDLTIGNGLHWTLPNFDMINSADVVIPLGSYNAKRPVNTGLHRWAVRVSHMGTWRPAPRWDVSYRLHTDFNFRNSATDYTSGQTVYLNVAVGWNPRPATTLGLTGYSLRQLTDDRQFGRSAGLNGNHVRVDGIGPGVKHVFPNHVMLVAKYFREFNVRNAPKGEQFWLYAAMPLGGPPKGEK
ncbi:MAG: transporter, partial [Opitutaceae bacterium]